METGSLRRNCVVLCATGALVVAAGLIACAPQVQETGSMGDGGAVVAETPKPMPAADEYGVVKADSWKSIYPNEYRTYRENDANSLESGKHDYLELYPALNSMYEGYAFALGYNEAAGHTHTLEDVKETPRTTEKAQLANCISCKTPQFTAMVNTMGEDIHKQPFWDVVEQFDEPISCYNCHENDPQSLTVTNKFFARALGPADSPQVSKEAQSCGQCHNEYYFDPETKATTNPYTGLENMTPDAILAYYDERGYKDWEHPETGAAMLKVQHPEFETLYGGAQTFMVKQGMTCADCHMGKKVAEDGITYVSHTWRSPLEDEELMEANCNTSGCRCLRRRRNRGQSGCHPGRGGSPRDGDQRGDRRDDRRVAEQRESGALSGDALAEVQRLHRVSQFYWDFVMVENSEGAHNPELTFETLDKAEAAVDQALSMLA